jgi:solute carrier family 25 carnitine/acylcarnitine transporter 20/29
MFTDNLLGGEDKSLFTDLCAVFTAWKRLRAQRVSGEKWSEADFAANVYNVFRSPTVRASSFR